MTIAFHRPATLSEAAALLDGDSALLAGGHTLIPAMKAGLRAPTALIDLTAVPGLMGIALEGERLRAGAMTRHAELAAADLIHTHAPGLADAAALVGDPMVRARGTLGGALANNDPAADYPAALLAFDAEIETNRRRIAADAFILGMFTTALDEGEIIASVSFRTCGQSAYAKFRHPASRYAMAGVCVARWGSEIRVGVAGALTHAQRWPEAEQALAADFRCEAVAGLTLDPADCLGDIHGSAEFRAHLAGVMLARAVSAAAARGA
ncbi:MAG: FAD binding domain-containing protein [Sphingomonadaceae bacterium]|nr:FAD binding domain-containing protein [Sphingomonadaceae bacterium]